MGANALAAISGLLGVLLLFGDSPLVGIVFLIFSATVWYKRPEAETIYGWIFAIAVAGIIASWVFGTGGGGGSELGYPVGY